MDRYIGSPGYTNTGQRLTGILVINLGTPDAPTPRAVRRYLAEFLSDPRVVEAPRIIWWLVLRAFILPLRPRRSAAAYRKVWTDEGSPLLTASRRQVSALEKALKPHFENGLALTLGMRYGNPSVASAMESLRLAGASRMVVLPLYPQYSGTTTASTFDAVASVLCRWRWLPELRFINHYHDHDQYIAAVADSVRDAWAESGRSERLLFSFHGIPRRYSEAGDPYPAQCHASAVLVADRLELPRESWAIAFQSRVGREEWLRPYTDQLLEQWAAAGIRSVDVVCPGFAADCLETLEEIAMENRDRFLEAGGADFRYIPALNDRPAHIDALADLVLGATQDWRGQAGDAARKGG